MAIKAVRYITCLIFFLLMFGSIDESNVWTMVGLLTALVMTIDKKTICQYFKVKNYWIFLCGMDVCSDIDNGGGILF